MDAAFTPAHRGGAGPPLVLLHGIADSWRATLDATVASPRSPRRPGAAGWPLDAARIDCPVRIAWGTADRLLPWPRGAERYRRDLLPNAEWIELDGVGHAPQLEVPLVTAELILGISAPGR